MGLPDLELMDDIIAGLLAIVLCFFLTWLLVSKPVLLLLFGVGAAAGADSTVARGELSDAHATFLVFLFPLCVCVLVILVGKRKHGDAEGLPFDQSAKRQAFAPVSPNVPRYARSERGEEQYKQGKVGMGKASRSARSPGEVCSHGLKFCEACDMIHLTLHEAGELGYWAQE